MTADASIEASVVIPAHNAGKDLGRCLRSVFASRDVELEVIVVDDASTDDTASIAREFPCRLITVDSNLMAANCRNLGAAHARGDVLVFFDADETMRPDTVRRFIDVLQAHPEVDAVVGSLTATTPATGFFSRLKNLQHHFTHQFARPEGATLDSGRMAIRRTAFEQLGGFEPAFAGASIEDIALGYRMARHGRKIRFEPSIQVVHHKEYDLIGMVRSDIVHRAIPWTGLMLRERVFRNDLNTRSENVTSVALAGAATVAALAALLGVPWALAALAAAVIAIPPLNAGLLRAALEHQGVWFALRTAAFLPFMYFYQGVGAVAGVAAWAAGRSVRRERKVPEADYRVIEPDDETGAAGRIGGSS